MKRAIAIVEDEPAIRANYCEALTRYGFDVTGYADRPSASIGFANTLPDMVIIDVGLADEAEGGFELCRSLRQQSATLPIIFLTARDNEVDEISALRLGADDYLTKSCSLQQLLARINALFRRMETVRQSSTAQPGTDECLKRGRLNLNLDRLSAHWNEHLLDLTVTEFWILHALVKHPGHVKNRTQLMDAANTVLDDNTITSHIKRIRRKFQELDDAFDAIQTAYGMGYRWSAKES
ncbi:MAG: proteobacterial dedicated sortase system response regulator [Hahellaceae bacterium]|nr:proteobacterial dedicated sortase system response regulator [Hahellaceae bacterium]MCP5169275.1 proteobacterial dedicated sortase system response regulator [Hahellaceae bacterium]